MQLTYDEIIDILDLKMVLRKITIDNSVTYIPTWEKTKETDIIPKK